MIFGLFSLYFSILELKKVTYERVSFKTQLKAEFLWLFSRHKKVVENIHGYRNFLVWQNVPLCMDH